MSVQIELVKRTINSHFAVDTLREINDGDYKIQDEGDADSIVNDFESLCQDTSFEGFDRDQYIKEISRSLQDESEFEKLFNLVKFIDELVDLSSLKEDNFVNSKDHNLDELNQSLQQCCDWLKKRFLDPIKEVFDQIKSKMLALEEESLGYLSSDK